MLSNNRLLLLLALLISAVGIHAEEIKSFSKQMNEIKRSGGYVYAESSAPNEADAKAACDALLKIEITKYLASADSKSKDNARIVKNIDEYDRKYLVQPRGDMIRVFGYVTRKSISGAEKSGGKKKSSTEGEVKKESGDEEEKAEPVSAEPAPLEPAPAESPEAVTEEIDLPEVSPAPASVETVSSEVLPEAQAATALVDGHLNADGLHLAKWQMDMLENIVKEQNMTQAKKRLNRYRNQNQIKRLGDRYVSNPRPTDSFYLIFDNSDRPLALLAPSSTGNHYDMISGTTVSLGSYSGNQFLWFQISK